MIYQDFASRKELSFIKQNINVSLELETFNFFQREEKFRAKIQSKS